MTSSFRLVIVTAALLAGGCASAPRSAGPASLADGQSHFVALDGHKVHYVTVGRGERTVVLVHGWAGNLGFWREQVPVLAAGARLILIDLPGHGQSDKPEVDYTLEFFARSVLAVMRDARVEKATLVGHSMGAAVICRVYVHDPGKVAALVSVDGALRRPPMTAAEVEAFTRPFRTPQYREHTTAFIGSLFPAGTESLRDQVIAELLATPQHVMRSAMDGMFGLGRSDWDLMRVPVPVLVINANSPHWPPDYEAYVRSLSRRTEYRTMDGVGHWLMLEKPAEFNALLTRMLQRFDLIAGDSPEP